jgi:hypothetical protein
MRDLEKVNRLIENYSIGGLRLSASAAPGLSRIVEGFETH